MIEALTYVEVRRYASILGTLADDRLYRPAHHHMPAAAREIPGRGHRVQLIADTG